MIDAEALKRAPDLGRVVLVHLAARVGRVPVVAPGRHRARTARAPRSPRKAPGSSIVPSSSRRRRVTMVTNERRLAGEPHGARSWCTIRTSPTARCRPPGYACKVNPSCAQPCSATSFSWKCLAVKSLAGVEIKHPRHLVDRRAALRDPAGGGRRDPPRRPPQSDPASAGRCARRPVSPPPPPGPNRRCARKPLRISHRSGRR